MLREAEVLTLIARGFTNREIADTLVISVETAKRRCLTPPAQTRCAEPVRQPPSLEYRLAAPGE